MERSVAAKAMSDHGIDGSITTVDPNLSEQFVQQLTNIFPKNWFDLINFSKTTSDDYFSQNNENFDLIYVDGDHRYNAVKNDWKNSENRFNKFLLFDDYHYLLSNKKISIVQKL